jgi:hypothetical protein
LNKESKNATARRRIDMASILHPVAKIVNKFNAIEKSGGTTLVFIVLVPYSFK